MKTIRYLKPWHVYFYDNYINLRPLAGPRVTVVGLRNWLMAIPPRGIETIPKTAPIVNKAGEIGNPKIPWRLMLQWISFDIFLNIIHCSLHNSKNPALFIRLIYLVIYIAMISYLLSNLLWKLLKSWKLLLDNSCMDELISVPSLKTWWHSAVTHGGFGTKCCGFWKAVP